MTMQPYPNIRLRQPIVQREFRGVNKDDPFSINDAYATYILNTDPTKYPVLSTRPGYSLLGGDVGRTLGLGVHKDTTLFCAFADGTLKYWTGSEWAQLTSGLSTEKYWSFANFKGGFSDICLLAVNGETVRKFDGSSLSSISAPSGLNYIEQYADRMWGLVGNTLHGSGYRDATDWTSTPPAEGIDDSVSFYTEIEDTSGEVCNALKSCLGQLVIFKPSSMYMLRGYAPSDYRIDPITSDIGVINNRCIAVLQSGMYFLDDGGIYLYRGDGVAPTKAFSKPVQWYIDNMKKSAKDVCSVGTDGTLLFVSIPMNSEVQPDTILVYDPNNKVWSVWNGHSAVSFANVGTNTYFGDYEGTVRLLGGLDDVGTPIAGRWVSKPFTGNSMAQKLRILRMYNTIDLPTGSTFGVYLSPSVTDDDWKQAGQTVQGSPSIQRRPIYFPSNIIPPTEQIRVKFEWTGPCTVHETAREIDQLPLR